MIFCDNINKKIEELFKKLPLDWDLIRLGWETNVSNKKTNSNKLEFVREIPDAGAFACVYNSNSIKKILTIGKTQFSAIDGLNMFLARYLELKNDPKHKHKYSHITNDLKENFNVYRSSQLLVVGASQIMI